MLDFLRSVWGSPVRAGPVVLGFLSFAVVNGIRVWFRIQYTPSYFVVFPVSLLDPDVARFTGISPKGRPKTDVEKRRLKRMFLSKAVGAALLTFVLIPLALGLIAATYMTTPEFAVTLTMLLMWQAYASYQSVTDNTRYSDKPRSSASFFIIFYVFYLASLGGFMHRGFRFAQRYAVIEDWAGLMGAAWNVVFFVVVAGGIVAVLANIMTYFITERDVL
jgi:hypothetical protein